jgi:hypothetical protein
MWSTTNPSSSVLVGTNFRPNCANPDATLPSSSPMFANGFAPVALVSAARYRSCRSSPPGPTQDGQGVPTGPQRNCSWLNSVGSLRCQSIPALVLEGCDRRKASTAPRPCIRSVSGRPSLPSALRAASPPPPAAAAATTRPVPPAARTEPETSRRSHPHRIPHPSLALP